ncbi:DoxX family protein [Vulgatibacter incomptus]|uniref:Putative integral membrane protein n=1 Tax=Vulgatibacter incomptus TaxID=1391653 RepID=A0A0K1PCC2_9BACT|nr:DoxX family protein [Vulgatibacter incomptus]AKU91157.1 putative integral membrane protein [Vulgatibacter incomptus]
MSIAAAAVAPTPSKAWGISLWIAQVLLAVMFGMAGLMKLATPMAELAEKMPGLPIGLVRFIGASEVAGALGMILPAITRIRPILTSVAGACLVIVMILAAGFHAMRGELPAVPMNFVLGALAAFVAWGRLRKAPIPPR